MKDLTTLLGMAILSIFLVVTAFFLGVASMVYGYGLEVKSWYALILCATGASFVKIIIKAVDNLMRK